MPDHDPYLGFQVSARAKELYQQGSSYTFYPQISQISQIKKKKTTTHPGQKQFTRHFLDNLGNLRNLWINRI